MGQVVKTRVVRVGNSRGVRIPKLLLEQAELGEEVELSAERGQIIIRPARRPRSGWEGRFREMAALGDDRLIDAGGASATAFDADEWSWSSSDSTSS